MRGSRVTLLYIAVSAVVILFALTVMLKSWRPSGFEIGGGGSTHHPPDRFVAGEPTKLELELSVWGEGSGRMSERWTQVMCHYRIADDASYTAVPLKPRTEMRNRIFFTCTIPPQSAAGSTIEYYFTMVFDGHASKREGARKLIENQCGTSGNGDDRGSQETPAGAKE